MRTDASSVEARAVLTQIIGGMASITFASHHFSKSDANQGPTEKECMAVQYAVGRCRQYFRVRHFTRVTDCSALTRLFGSRDLSAHMVVFPSRGGVVYTVDRILGCLTPQALGRRDLGFTKTLFGLYPCCYLYIVDNEKRALDGTILSGWVHFHVLRFDLVADSNVGETSPELAPPVKSYGLYCTR